MYTKEDWKTQAVKLSALWGIVMMRRNSEFEITDLVLFETLTATSKHVTEMVLEEDKESSENPTEEKLHEMMEQAAREICDERDS